MSIELFLAHPYFELMPVQIKILILGYSAAKVLDFTTGLLKTWKGVSRFDSDTMRNGIIRWIGELVAIAFVLLLDLILGLNFYLTGFTISLFLYKEGGSIAENLSAIGVTLPGIVVDKLDTFNRVESNKNEKKEEEERKNNELL